MFERCASRNVLLIVNTATRPTTPLRTTQTRRAFTSEVECRKCPILRGIAIRKFGLGSDVIYHAMTSPSSVFQSRSQNNSKIDGRHYNVKVNLRGNNRRRRLQFFIPNWCLKKKFIINSHILAYFCRKCLIKILIVVRNCDVIIIFISKQSSALDTNGKPIQRKICLGQRQANTNTSYIINNNRV